MNEGRGKYDEALHHFQRATELEPGNFIVKYTNKGKEITVKTENNFKVMVSKPPNADGVFEVRIELKGAPK